MYQNFISFILLTIFFVSCGPAPEMPEYQSEESRLFTMMQERNFNQLPLTGTANSKGKFWSGNYWPMRKGNINYRWNSPRHETFGYDSPTQDEVIKMSQEEIAVLSPSEKFDLYMGRYDYPLKKEVYTYAHPDAKSWEGICNGWSPATINHNEPTPKTVRNRSGVIIPFGSSDIKALISYYYAFIHKAQTTGQMGRRCPAGRWFNWDEDCKDDLDAGEFHVFLTNKLGKRSESFLVDIERYKEVWNHPAISYESEIEKEENPSRHDPEGTAKVIKMKTRVTYLNGQRTNSWEPVLGTPAQSYSKREYTYELYLNEKNDVMSGKWTSKDRPDFLWTMSGTRNFQGLLQGLGELLND